MKRILPFILSMIILFQSMNVSAKDIIQMDEFIEHAQFHYEEYGDDLFAFISKHYGDQKEEHQKNQQHEKSQHEQLPFNHNLGSHTSTIFLADFIENENLSTPFAQILSPNFFYLLPAISAAAADIFQPPKIA
ncbi:hypothetical protein [Acidiluteibacter ferrifornacis]|uniref:Uncharacterized protein n=1 Tax=Acidiluteibacter ferrifornacis TaxID=2692424 RepID=A0A6N9NFB4_9FLAO|nr:hypothetical protein [Acidiluteibacter ferrifornacis]NBG64563.1 hypothetical protein [Acidiluteibacter ferrifornacis]